MKLLALDTSSLACSVAFSDGTQLVERHEEEEREHTRLLIPMIREVLADAGVEPADLDAIVLGNGPGSFIGVRIAASVAQGLAYGAGASIIPVSSMLAVAGEAAAGSDACEIVVTQDAHMNEVYLGVYRSDDDGAVVPVIDERLHDQGPIAEISGRSGVRRVAAGHGWQRYPDLKAANQAHIDEFGDTVYPHAGYLLRAADERAAIAPEEVVPAYLRQKVATKPGDRRP
ncbi:MAG: tRNA (adenosine(37)-N6)-threonylcarbamoyltransferase complex dimerization subunit type 1 TsaB [Woeseiaceae bacterium]|nr:tRNA (adenosine(37)-N6)-threonylcarbamoyltransferase complex dimerization subunit type 1 TsaB [Woeseiaceae bacterium]